MNQINESNQLLKSLIKEQIIQTLKEADTKTIAQQLKGKTVVNPETKKKILATTALSYGKDHPSYKAAIALLKKAVASVKAHTNKNNKSLSKAWWNAKYQISQYQNLKNQNKKPDKEKIEDFIYSQEKYSNASPSEVKRLVKDYHSEWLSSRKNYSKIEDYFNELEKRGDMLDI